MLWNLFLSFRCRIKYFFSRGNFLRIFSILPLLLHYCTPCQSCNHLLTCLESFILYCKLHESRGCLLWLQLHTHSLALCVESSWMNGLFNILCTPSCKHLFFLIWRVGPLIQSRSWKLEKKILQTLKFKDEIEGTHDLLKFQLDVFEVK